MGRSLVRDIGGLELGIVLLAFTRGLLLVAEGMAIHPRLTARSGIAPVGKSGIIRPDRQYEPRACSCYGCEPLQHSTGRRGFREARVVLRQ